MDVFAISVIIFLLLCVIALIISIVFFPGTPRTTTTVTTVKNVPVSTPGNDLDNDDDYPLSSGYDRRNWRSNINTSTNLTFLNELYAELARSRDFTTIGGSNSNFYVNSWLSGASGYWSGGSNASYNRNNCSSFTDCRTCSYAAGCGWCSSSQKCVYTDTQGFSINRECSSQNIVNFPSDCSASGFTDVDYAGYSPY